MSDINWMSVSEMKDSKWIICIQSTKTYNYDLWVYIISATDTLNETFTTERTDRQTDALSHIFISCRHTELLALSYQ